MPRKKEIIDIGEPLDEEEQEEEEEEEEEGDDTEHAPGWGLWDGIKAIANDWFNHGDEEEE